MADAYKFPVRLRAAMAHAAVVLSNSSSSVVRELDEDSQHLIRRTLDELDSACAEANLAVRTPPATARADELQSGTVRSWSGKSPADAPCASQRELPAGYAYSLVDLQSVAHARFGLSPAQTLSIAQALYERGLISYPRVGEERLLPLTVWAGTSRLVRGFAMASGSREYDWNYQSQGWVDEVPGAHHGITLTTGTFGAQFGLQLSEDETRIYGLVHSRTLDMFKRPAA